MILHHESTSCVICNRKLQILPELKVKKCLNKCYYERVNKKSIIVRIFGEEFRYHLDLNSPEHIENVKIKIKGRIEYWKKDCRYVTKIFEKR